MGLTRENRIGHAPGQTTRFTPVGDSANEDTDRAGRGGGARGGRAGREKRPLPPPRPRPIERVWALEQLTWGDPGPSGTNAAPAAAAPQSAITDWFMVALAAVGAALVVLALWV